MRAYVVARERHPVLSQWISRKSTRLALLMSALVIVSVAVNALIILAGAKP